MKEKIGAGSARGGGGCGELRLHCFGAVSDTKRVGCASDYFEEVNDAVLFACHFFHCA